MHSSSNTVWDKIAIRSIGKEGSLISDERPRWWWQSANGDVAPIDCFELLFDQRSEG